VRKELGRIQGAAGISIRQVLGSDQKFSIIHMLAFRLQSQIAKWRHSFSCDTGDFDRAFLWENSSIIDLNAVIPTDSLLKLVATNDINDRGEGTPPGCSDFTACGHAFLLIPCARTI
jgi:hypothetical protein